MQPPWPRRSCGPALPPLQELHSPTPAAQASPDLRVWGAFHSAGDLCILSLHKGGGPDLVDKSWGNCGPRQARAGKRRVSVMELSECWGGDCGILTSSSDFPLGVSGRPQVTGPLLPSGSSHTPALPQPVFWAESTSLTVDCWDVYHTRKPTLLTLY